MSSTTSPPAPARATSAIGAPRQIDLGDQEIGSQTFHLFHLFNADPQAEAVAQVRVHGDPSIAVGSVPQRLRPSREGFDPTKQARLVFSPTSHGRVAATLEVAMAWIASDRPPERLTISVNAAAHRPGERPLAEQEAEVARLEQLRRDDETSATGRARTQRAIEAEAKRDTRFHTGHLRELANARQRAEVALVSLYGSRKNGAAAACAEVGTFVRSAPVPEQPDLLEQLAFLALDIASAGIAGGIAKRLDPIVSRVLRATVLDHGRPDGSRVGGHSAPTSPAVVAVITDGIKHVVKQRGAFNALRKPTTATGPTSTDAMVAFFLALQESLTTQQATHVLDVTITTHDALLPLLKTHPEQAIAAMNAIAAEVNAEQKQAASMQLEQAVQQWIRYVAQSSMGALDGAAAADRGLLRAGHDSLTDVAQANTKLTDTNLADDARLQSYDGLFDISFRGDAASPERPVVAIDLRIAGMRPEVRARFASQPLRDLALPLRATGFLGSPSMSVTVVRDEAGNIAYVDNTAAPGQTPRWLSRKAGARSGRATDQLRGARILLDELLSHPIPVAGTGS